MKKRTYFIEVLSIEFLLKEDFLIFVIFQLEKTKLMLPPAIPAFFRFLSLALIDHLSSFDFYSLDAHGGKLKIPEPDGLIPKWDLRTKK